MDAAVSRDGGYDYGLPGGEVVTLYGGLAYRWWAGTPGESELVSGHTKFWGPVPKPDRELYEEQTKLRARAHVAMVISQRWGIELSWASPSLDRIEWLVIWDPGADLLDRLHAYEGGWSAALPPGKQVADLTSEDIGQLARRSGLVRQDGSVRTRRVDYTPRAAGIADVQQPTSDERTVDGVMR